MPSGELFTRYVIPLAAIGPVCAYLGGQIYGAAPFSHGLVGGALFAASSYAISLVNLLVMSFITSRLAPRYGGEASPRNAFKLITYSSTAAWLAGFAALFPSVGFLGLLSLYSLYLYFIGVGPMMHVPAERRGRFNFITIACALLLNAVTSAVSLGPVWMQRDGGRFEFRIPGNSHSEARQIGDMAREIRDAIRHDKLKAVPAGKLQALLPVAIGDFTRTAMDSATSQPGGSHAEGTYEGHDKRFTLKIVDLAAFGAIAQLGTTFDIDRSKEDVDGFEHVTTKDGKLIVEKWDRAGHDGGYATMIGKRFLIEAKGEADSIDQLKAAVASIDAGKLAALGK